jgi:hypothetical protein
MFVRKVGGYSDLRDGVPTVRTYLVDDTASKGEKGKEEHQNAPAIRSTITSSGTFNAATKFNSSSG